MTSAYHVVILAKREAEKFSVSRFYDWRKDRDSVDSYVSSASAYGVGSH